MRVCILRSFESVYCDRYSVVLSDLNIPGTYLPVVVLYISRMIHSAAYIYLCLFSIRDFMQFNFYSKFSMVFTGLFVNSWSRCVSLERWSSESQQFQKVDRTWVLLPATVLADLQPAIRGSSGFHGSFTHSCKYSTSHLYIKLRINTF